MGTLPLDSVTPTPISTQKRVAVRRAAQDDLTRLGWPVQHVPPRPGMPVRKARKRRKQIDVEIRQSDVTLPCAKVAGIGGDLRMAPRCKPAARTPTFSLTGDER
jgi:hypothetical protein